MASMALTTTLSKLQATRIFLGTSPRPFQVKFSWNLACFQASRRYCAMATYDETAEAAKQGRHAANKGADAAKKGGQQVKNEAAPAADNAAQKTKDMAGKVSDAAQEAAGKVKQTAQDAWGSVKDTTGKIKDTVVGKAEATADCATDTIREEAAKVERSFNSKN
ncbi:hypothetical protein Pfo_006525 [Paulownia fortunei]|nr:hypothetical protein Pfo_006525 [Paulownia fortunei]